MGQRSRFQQELVKLTLRLDRAAGRLVVGWGQFWRLEGEALAEEAWKALQRARGVLRLPPDLPARTLPTRLHAASFLPSDQNPCRVWPSATWRIAGRKCAYQAQIADNSQIEFYGAAETLSENYRRLGPDKHICDRRLAKSPMARPGTGFGRLEGKRRRAASRGACGEAVSFLRLFSETGSELLSLAIATPSPPRARPLWPRILTFGVASALVR